MQTRTPVVWIPGDDLGISEEEIALAERGGWEVSISNERTWIDAHKNIEIQGDPPT